MATVYLAGDVKHDRTVAVKVLRPDLAAVLGSDRFLREIKITAQLNHPHILPLLDSGEANDFLYYVMPYVAGGSLRGRLNRDKRLGIEETLRLAQPVAAALDHAHRHGVVHRDVKPENILFSEGLAVVADFGIAKAVSAAGPGGLTRSGFPVGTPGYMSPEQAAGRTDLGAPTDVFGLACVVYEMLIGETPEAWATEEAVRLGRFLDASAAHRERLDGFPGRIEQTLVKALAIRPSDRFASPIEFAAALTATSPGSLKLPDAEVDAVLGRAAALDTEQLTEGGALSIGGVEQVAAQVGIPPARVREAMRDLERQPGFDREVVRESGREPTVFRKGRLVIERAIAGEVPASVYEAMVAEIQRTLGFVGTVSTVGKSLNWSGLKPGFVGRDVRITLATSFGMTRVHVEEHIELRGASIFAPAWGAAGGVLVGLGLVFGLGLPEQALLGIALPGAFAGAILTATLIPKRLARHYRPQLEELADRLAATAHHAALPSPPEEAHP
jgi:hypothetical protein